MAKDPELLAHLEWLGYVQPVGLVVSPPALLAAQAYVNKNIIREHERFLEHVEDVVDANGEDSVLAIRDFPSLVREVFGWQADDLVDSAALDSLEVVLTEYGETLRPTYAVKELEPATAGGKPWQMLVQVVDTAVDLDTLLDRDEHRWQASLHSHFERLLRETEVPIGVLFNGTHFRLVYAPRGETSGYITFPVHAMAQVDGRPIFAALHMLLSAERLFTLPRKQRLPSLLSESRKYQTLVSTKLSGQVLNSLYELLQGFQAADDTTRGELLRQALREEPNHVYAQVSQWVSFAFLPTGMVYSHLLVVFPFDTFEALSLLHGRPHEEWARFYSYSLEERFAYGPSDRFDTFPFPKNLEAHPMLESAGKEYYEFRAPLMVRNNEGLTKTYNRFHDPEEQSPDILRLRELHAAMDRAVLDAYGWTDLHPTCEFLLDYEEEEVEDETPTRGRGRKKPWRYRWPDEFRDEVLARLLELNRQYAEEERLSGAAAEKKGKKRSATKGTSEKGRKKTKGDDAEVVVQPDLDLME